MIKALEHIANQVKNYRELNPMDGEGLVKCLQQISSTLHYLEGQRSNYHDKWQTIVHQEILKGEAVNRAENMGYIKVPELYRLRHVMKSAYLVCEAIRSQVSYVKHEMNISK